MWCRSVFLDWVNQSSWVSTSVLSTPFAMFTTKFLNFLCASVGVRVGIPLINSDSGCWCTQQKIFEYLLPSWVSQSLVVELHYLLAVFAIASSGSIISCSGILNWYRLKHGHSLLCLLSLSYSLLVGGAFVWLESGRVDILLLCYFFGAESPLVCPIPSQHERQRNPISSPITWTYVLRYRYHRTVPVQYPPVWACTQQHTTAIRLFVRRAIKQATICQQR